MTNVVIDTNIVISGIFWPETAPDFVLGLIPAQKIIPVLSETLAEEITNTSNRIVEQYGFNQNLIRIWETIFKKYALWVDILPQIEICRDPKDNMVLATAVAGDVHYIITGDKDLLGLKRYKKIKIVTAKRFLEEAME